MQLTSVQVEQKEPCVWELTVEVAPEEVQRATESVLRQLSRSLRVPGFRPGHVPPGIIKRWVGEEQIRRQVLEDLLPNALMAAIEQRALEPVVTPEWRDVQFADDASLRFVAEVITRPEVQLGDYKGLKLRRVKLTVSEEMLQQALEEVRQDLARYEPTDEPAQPQDRVRVRYQVLAEDEQPTDQWQSGTFTAGAEGWVPPLPERLVGRAKGDEDEFTYTYPDDHQNPDLAGKTVRVRFVVESVLRRHVPELTDEVVRQELGMDSVQALKEELRRELEGRLRRTARASERAQAEEALLQSCSVTVPNALIDKFTDQLLAETEASLRQRGLTLSQWLQAQNSTLEEYRQQLRQEAERRLKLRFILEAIAQREGIVVTDEEVLQAMQGAPQEMDEDTLATLRRQWLEQRVIDLVLMTAEWVEEEPAESGQVPPASAQEGAHP
jgi:trigger factor